MTNNTSAENQQKLHESFAQGDMEQLTQMISPDVLWHIMGRSPIAGTYNGRDATLGFLGKVAGETNGSLSLSNYTFMGTGGRSVAIFTYSASRKGKTIKIEVYESMRWKDGMCIEHWGIPLDQYAYDEFWA